MPRFPVLIALTLGLLVAGCEDVADTVRDNKTLHAAGRMGALPLVYREF
jgi:hypothetical protein